MELEELIAWVEEGTVVDEPLARVAAARDLCVELNALGDQVVDHFVEAARREGCSWSQIGSVLGVTRQGAQQRYGGVFRRVPFAGGRRPLQRTLQVARFGRDARTAVVQAQAMARELQHDHVDTEHLLLGILAGADSVGATLLARAGLEPDAVRSEVTSIVGRGTEAPPGRIPFAPAGKKALELALREALVLDDPRIGTEHLLLALCRERKGVAARVLAARGIDRNRVLRELESLGRDAPPAR